MKKLLSATLILAMLISITAVFPSVSFAGEAPPLICEENAVIRATKTSSQGVDPVMSISHHSDAGNEGHRKGFLKFNLSEIDLDEIGKIELKFLMYRTNHADAEAKMAVYAIRPKKADWVRTELNSNTKDDVYFGTSSTAFDTGDNNSTALFVEEFETPPNGEIATIDVTYAIKNWNNSDGGERKKITFGLVTTVAGKEIPNVLSKEGAANYAGKDPFDAEFFRDKAPQLVFTSIDDIEGSTEVFLNGDDFMKIEKGSAFTDPGAYAINALGQDISSEITVDGMVNTEVSGTYIITYSVIDEDDNTISVTRKVKVGYNTLPVPKNIITPTASSNSDSNPAPHLVDGTDGAYWQPRNGSGYCWVKLELGKTFDIDTVDIKFLGYNTRVSGYQFFLSQTGEGEEPSWDDYIEVEDGVNAKIIEEYDGTANLVTIDMYEPVAARYLVFYILRGGASNSGNPQISEITPHYVKFAESELAHSIATKSSYADNAFNVELANLSGSKDIEDATLIVAVYNDQNILKRPYFKTISIQAQGQESESFTDIELSSGDKVKTMVWSSLSAAKPLSVFDTYTH
ncbi:MAG: DUF5011 domain-containing protein [Firmicutes bacterium]|nr:DUF5011 domain-containing protein [Bacillota bacterium]